MTDEIVVSYVDEEVNDLTAPYYELEAFDSIWDALTWKQIRTRVPICMKKTIRSRYMLANLVYLGYAIGILIIDFNPHVNGSTSSRSDEPAVGYTLVNRLYIGK